MKTRNEPMIEVSNQNESSESSDENAPEQDEIAALKEKCEILQNDYKEMTLENNQMLQNKEWQ